MNVIFGLNDKQIPNNLISQISYSIHKYWIVCNEENTLPTEKRLMTLVAKDLEYQSKIMYIIKETSIANIYLNVAPWLLPKR